MTLIIIGIMLLFVVSIVWTWHNLGNIEKPNKLAFIIIGLLIAYLLTMLLYNLSNPDITYPSEENQKTVSNNQSNSVSEKEQSGDNYKKYTLETADTYYVVEYVDKTALYAEVDLEYKDELNNVLDELGY